MILTTDYGVDVMVKYIVLVLIGCLLIAQSVEAETKNTRQLGIGFGLFTMRSQDNLASPFTYNGDGRGWLIKYRAQNARHRHHISFQWLKFSFILVASAVKCYYNLLNFQIVKIFYRTATRGEGKHVTK